MGPEITILTVTASVTAARAIISGVILIARGPGSNQNFAILITIVRPIGIGPNFGAGIIGRSTGRVTLGVSTGDLTIPWSRKSTTITAAPKVILSLKTSSALRPQ
jgi:hypothetical protein